MSDERARDLPVPPGRVPQKQDLSSSSPADETAPPAAESVAAEPDFFQRIVKRTAGIDTEVRTPSTLEKMIAGGVGGLGGQAVAKVLRLGWPGTALGGLCGAIVAHIAITYRVVQPYDEPDPLPQEG